MTSGMGPHGKASIADLFGQRMVFRNLDAIDGSLPRFSEIMRELSLPGIPRKDSPGYAKVIMHLLGRMNPGFRSIICIGDTPLDMAVMKNLKALSGARVFGFVMNPGMRGSGDETLLVYEKWEDLLPFLKKAGE